MDNQFSFKENVYMMERFDHTDTFLEYISQILILGGSSRIIFKKE